MRLVRMAEKGSKTILHRGFTESIKNILKTIKLTENTDIQKAMAIHGRRLLFDPFTMFLEICMQIYSVVFSFSRQINKQKVCENN